MLELGLLGPIGAERREFAERHAEEGRVELGPRKGPRAELDAEVDAQSAHLRGKCMHVR